MELYFSANATVCVFANAPVNCDGLYVHIGGISAVVAPQTRRIIEGILSTDEPFDGEGFGEGYQMWACFRRGQSSHMETNGTLTLDSCTQPQRLSSVLLALHLRFVLVHWYQKQR
jgi:hypothetical protein